MTTKKSPHRKVEFKRVGPAKASRGTHYAYLTVEVTLDGEPSLDWVECFKNPATFIPDEAHPSKAQVKGNTIVFTSFRTHVRTNVQWMDKYIKQANECYQAMSDMYKDQEKSQLEREQAEKTEIEKINESLKDL